MAATAAVHAARSALEHAARVRRNRVALMRGGARQLLQGVEWETERALHIGRGVMWVAFYALMLLGWQFSFGQALAGLLSASLARVTGTPAVLQVAPGSAADWAITAMTFGGGAAGWLVYWRILHRTNAWKWLRFLVIGLDVLSVVRFAIAAESTRRLGQSASVVAEQLVGVTPAALLLISMTGVLRLHPITTVVAGLSAIAGQVAVNRVLGHTTEELSAQVALLVATLVLGVNFVFILRSMGLKAAQEQVLEHFVPAGLTERLARAGGTVPARVVPVTILIADIRGFTTISEPLGPVEAVALLNSFFATMVDPLVAEGAVLDKYLGDGMLAFVEGDDHAARGLRAAHRIVTAVTASNEGRQVPLRIGIAVHTAPAFVGSIGAPARMEYTIIGDAVNVTSRLEGLMSSKAGAERIDAQIVASRDTVDEAARSGYTLPELCGPHQVAVHGRAQSLDVYYLPA